MDKSVNIGIIPLSIPGHQSGLEFAQKNWESHHSGLSLTIDSNFLTWCCVFGGSHKIDHHLDMNPALQPNSSNGINAVPGVQGSIMGAFLAQFVGCKRVVGGAILKNTKDLGPQAAKPSAQTVVQWCSVDHLAEWFQDISSIWSWNPDVLRYPKEVWGSNFPTIIQDHPRYPGSFPALPCWTAHARRCVPHGSWRRSDSWGAMKRWLWAGSPWTVRHRHPWYWSVFKKNRTTSNHRTISNPKTSRFPSSDPEAPFWSRCIPLWANPPQKPLWP